jgi:hypothetical protein
MQRASSRSQWSTSSPPRPISSPSATRRAASDAIHAGISAKDAIVTVLTGATVKSKDHAAAAKELRRVLAKRPEAATAERALRELVACKRDVEYGTNVVTATKAEPLVRRARTLVELAIAIVRLGG